MSPSVIPSHRYSSSGLPLVLTNGRTATESTELPKRNQLRLPTRTTVPNRTTATTAVTIVLVDHFAAGGLNAPTLRSAVFPDSESRLRRLRSAFNSAAD